MTIVLAVLAAVFMGMASAAQHHATQQVDLRPALHPGLVLALLRRPWWLLGSSASVVGSALQVAALATGSIIVVQTIMISSLVWTAIGESLIARRHLSGRSVAAVGLAAAGVAGLLFFLQPRLPPDPSSPTIRTVCAVVAGCVIVVVAGLQWAAHGPARSRALGLALTTGVGYGLTAALLKLVSAQVQHGGWPEPFHHPALYAVAVLGPAAVMLSQNTLQYGKVAAPALTIVLLFDPLVGLATGLLWFGEHLAAGAGDVAGAAACTVAAIAGVAIGQTAPVRP